MTRLASKSQPEKHIHAAKNEPAAQSRSQLEQISFKPEKPQPVTPTAAPRRRTLSAHSTATIKANLPV
jgi:hypothetical protein